MNKKIQVVLAKSVIELAETKDDLTVIHKINKGKFIEQESFSNFQAIKDIIDSGISVVMPIDYQGKVSTLMTHVIDVNSSDDLLDYFLSKLTEQDVSMFSISMVNEIYEKSYNNIVLLDKFFTLGFNFEQGQFNEVEKALNGDIEFFELCMQKKHDFKFGFKYENDLSLDQILADDIKYCKINQYRDNDLQKRESLLSFLQKAKAIEDVKDELNKNLKTNPSLLKTKKI